MRIHAVKAYIVQICTESMLDSLAKVLLTTLSFDNWTRQLVDVIERIQLGVLRVGSHG